MYHHILKSLKISFWILVPLLFISNTKAEPLTVPNNFEGNYDLKATGAIEQSLEGTVSFKAFTESSNNGTSFSSLSLTFVNNEQGFEHELEFIISEQNESELLSTGKYEIKDNIDGFLNNFDGVFGYANINIIGEQPFFTTMGKVVITRIGKADLKGYVDVNLRSNGGKVLMIKGDFHAIKRN